MPLEQMRARVRELIESFKVQIAWMESEEIFAVGEYTWQEALAENTGVELTDENSVDQLSADALWQIVNTFV